MNQEELRALARSTIEQATTCTDHLCKAPQEKDWKRVVHAWSDQNGMYSESSSVCVVELLDGRCFVATEWGDTTGHGCQCGGSVSLWSTLADAERLGLSNDEREHLGIRLSDVVTFDR